MHTRENNFGYEQKDTLRFLLLIYAIVWREAFLRAGTWPFYSCASRSTQRVRVIRLVAKAWRPTPVVERSIGCQGVPGVHTEILSC